MSTQYECIPETLIKFWKVAILYETRIQIYFSNVRQGINLMTSLVLKHLFFIVLSLSTAVGKLIVSMLFLNVNVMLRNYYEIFILFRRMQWVRVFKNKFRR